MSLPTGNAWSQLMVGKTDLMLREHPSFPGSLILAGQGELGDVADKLPLGVFNHVEKVGLYTNIHLDGCGLAGWVLGELGEDDAFSITQTDQPRYYLVEFSSPNANKPQHLGHCRNNVLGQTISNLLKALGHVVRWVNRINDVGIHICKSLYAWIKDGRKAFKPSAEVPKGDHFVGGYYVAFNKLLIEEFESSGHAGISGGMTINDWFNSESSVLGKGVREILHGLEANDPKYKEGWEYLTGLCVLGFEDTYRAMGISFCEFELESQDWIKADTIIKKGLDLGIFKCGEGQKVTFDLSQIGLVGEKVIRRTDGSGVYLTQDLCAAFQRRAKYSTPAIPPSWSGSAFSILYVVGDEQQHHFQILFGILRLLNGKEEDQTSYTFISHGMVNLPNGRMKSREGTTVDADFLMEDLKKTCAGLLSKETAEVDPEAAHQIGLAALKFFLLKYAPGTSFVFDAEKSLSTEGETGVYCLYAYARICGIFRKLGNISSLNSFSVPNWGDLDNPKAQALLLALIWFPRHVEVAAKTFRPNILTKAVYTVAKAFSSYYQSEYGQVLNIKDTQPSRCKARVRLLLATQTVLSQGLGLMGINHLKEM